MSKLMRVAVNEFRTNVMKRSFLLALLSLPLFLTFSIGMGMIMESVTSSKKPIGFVDQAGVIQSLEMPWLDTDAESIEVRPFTTLEEANAALQAGQIQGYFTIPADYLETGDVDLTIVDEVSDRAQAQFSRLLRYNVVLESEPGMAVRITKGLDLIVQSPDGSRTYPEGGPPFSLTLPLIVSAGFVFVLLMSAGYAMGAVAGERESRTMEVLVTSISPGALLRGKLLGILGISLTLMICWSLIGVGAVWAGARVFDSPWLQQASIDWRSLGAVLLIALPNYISALAVMIMVGSTVGEVQEGQALSGMFLLIFFLPIYALTAIGNDPSGTFPIVLSFLPFTSLMTLGIRNMFTAIPTAQILLGFLVQAGIAGLLVWFAGRAFRIGMLRIGQRTRLRDLLGRQVGRESGGAR
jgi:ABC-2 type transport system permease protein